MFAHLYSFSPTYIYEELTWPQVRMYLRNAASIAYRDHLPTANLTAVLLNILGGKTNKPATPGFVAYTPEELLPPYAQPEDMVFASVAVSAKAAKEFLRMSRDGELPRWVQAIANYDMMRKAAGEE